MTSNTGTIVNSDLLDRLNTEQKEAVCLKWGPSLIVAGAGSGKTTVLTRRVAYLLRELRQAPYTILGVTFTNKAAGEMRARLEALVGEQTAKKLTIGTFHSICARLLRNDIDAYTSPEGHKWSNNFVIYDETDTLSLVKDVIGKLNLDDKMYAPREMRNKISSFKNDGIDAATYSQGAKRYADEKFANIFSGYQAALARNNAMDFDDLILIFSQLLEQNLEVRQRLQERFKHILVDEFQDTNHSQFKLIKYLAPIESKLASDAEIEALWNERSLLVVGDVDQSIYSWRKADFRIILNFQNDYRSCKMIKLEENYRSTSTILDVANNIIKNNTERIEKELRCNRGKGGKVRLHGGTDEIDEAYFVAEETKRLQARGISLSDCAVLYRTNAMSRAIEEVLVRSHIPYTMVGGTRFYDRAEIKDVISYLKFIYNPMDTQSFQRCVNNPKRGLGKTSIEHLLDYAEKAKIGPLEACLQAHKIADLGGKAGKSLSEFGIMAERWVNMAAVMPVSELLELVLSQSTYLLKLQQDAAAAKDELATGRVENVQELLAVAKDFESIADEPTLEAFLTRIALVSDLDAIKAGEDAIKLMTLHSAKGLEFQNVFLIGLEDGLFPHSRTFDSPPGLEEERRLMYVGVTRAEERLYLTYARKRASFQSGNFGQSNYTLPSRFLNEISGDLMMGLEALADVKQRDDSRNGGAGYDGGGSYGGYGNSEKRSFGSGSGEWGSERSSRGGNDSYGGRSSGSYGGSNQSYGSRSSGNQSYGGGNQSYGSRSSNQSYGNRPGGQSYGNQQSPAARQSSPPAKPRVLSRSGPQDAPSGGSGIAPKADFERLKTGDQVMHTKFGVGVVAEVIGEGDKELYAVKFESAGKRVLDPRFAKLVKMN